MKIETLADFLTLVKCRGFGRAARQLYTTQPSLSSRIAAMEKELGFEVVDRSNSTFSLTPAGSAFLGYAQEIVDAYGKGRSEGRALGREGSPLRVAGIGTDSREFQLVSAIGDPAFVFVSSDMNTPFFDLLVSGRADIELTPDVAAVERLGTLDPQHEYATVPAGYGRGAIAMQASHPLAAREELTSADLDGATVTIGSLTFFEEWRDVIGVMLGEDVHAQFRLRHADNVGELARAELGDTLHICAFESVETFYGHRDDIVIRTTVDGRELRYPLCAAYRADAPDARVAELAQKIGQVLSACEG